MAPRKRSGVTWLVGLALGGLALYGLVRAPPGRAAAGPPESATRSGAGASPAHVEPAGAGDEIGAPDDAPAQAAARAAVAARSTPAEEAPERVERPLDLQVVDARTGEPVPDLHVVVESEARGQEDLRTDAEGRLVSRRAYATQPLRVHLLDEGDPAQDLIQTGSARAEALAYEPVVAFEHDAAALDPHVRAELAVPVGPTLRLAVRLPPGATARDLVGILTTRDRSKAFDKLYARGVVDGDLVRLRFAPLAHLIGAGAALGLRVGTDDGAWYGELPVASPYGVQPVQTLLLEPRAALAGELRDVDGPLPGRHWVKFARLVPEGEERPRMEATLAEGGEYHARWLVPGRYRVTVEVDGRLPFARELELEPGAQSLDVVLEPDGVARDGTIAGRVESATGRFRGPLLLYASPTAPEDARGESASTDARFVEEDGRLVGRFTFVGLRADARYTVRPLEAGLVVRPAELEAAPGDRELVFHVVDDRALHPLTVRAVDGTTGAALDAFEVQVRLLGPGSDSHLRRSAADAVARFDALPVDAELEWTLVKVGYAPAFGDERAARAGDEGLELEVPLERGWGMRVEVRDDAERPVAGARVLLDGEDVGATGADGRLDVRAPAAPEGLTILHRGAEQPVLPFRPWIPRIVVRLGG